MNFLVGWLIGERIAGAAGEVNDQNGNALWGIFWWVVIGGIGGFAASSNFGPKYGWYGESGTTVLVLLFCIWRPLASDFKMMMLAAIRFIAGWVMVLSGGYVVVRIGWALISGKLKSEGLASLPAASLVHSCIYAICSFAAAALVGFVLERDRLRIQIARDALSQRRLHESQPRRERVHSAENDAAREQRDPPHEKRHEPPSAPPEEMWWVVLGVEPDCSRGAFEAAARDLLRQYHPDRVMDAPPLLKAEAERLTKRILKARAEARAAKPSD